MSNIIKYKFNFEKIYNAATLIKAHLNTLDGVGLKLTEKLSKLGLHTIQDILFHFPIKYEDRKIFYKIKNLSPNTYASVKGTILEISTVSKKILTCKITDGTGILFTRFFNSIETLKKILIPKKHIIVYGLIKLGKQGIEIIHPKYQIQKNLLQKKYVKQYTPFYITTKGLHQSFLRKLNKYALNILKNHKNFELLPMELNNNMMNIVESINILHNPPSKLILSEINKRKHPAQKKLITEELLAYILNIFMTKKNIKHFSALSIPPSITLKKKLLKNLSFQLTYGQEKVLKEIEYDLSKVKPMIRLLQGDVGSGKTIIAALSALHVISSGKQVVLMVPTELLAQQHANNFNQWFQPLGIKISCLIGKKKNSIKHIEQKNIAENKISMIIGTHAVFQKKVRFHCLALIIIDEQHKFGVHQRLALRKKGEKNKIYPHQLIMTATPIPRTLFMTLYADFNVSVIDIKPLNRKKVITLLISHKRRKEVINRIYNVCKKENRQVYWVCTLIEKSIMLKAENAKTCYKNLKKILPDVNIGLIHGKMKKDEKQRVMSDFKKNEIKILVATTIIEVGVDVPNATFMIIENPERLGLAQLHQLRGRVGRSLTQSYCVLLYNNIENKESRKKLKILKENHDGFKIAEHDLTIRGPGELFGTNQTGIIKFKIANLNLDQKIILKAKKIALYIYKYYPHIIKPLIARWCYKKI